MSFAEELRKRGNFTRTENGAVALASTMDACLDLFGTVGSLRQAKEERVQELFDRAYQENPLLAAKIAFYARDIRGGLGERNTFRILMKHMANHYPEALGPNLDLVGVFGRYDDLYCLIGTQLEDAMWEAMKKQFEEDRENLAAGNSISLLAKWIKTADASAKETRRLGILTAQKLGYPVYDFKRIVRAMRKHIGIVEALMSANRWDEIKYSEVPSRAMMIYRKAFLRHDEERFTEFSGKAAAGEVKINSSTLFPYDIVEKFLYQDVSKDGEAAGILEAQWKQLPNYVEEGTNVLVMADVSGSMYGRPMATSIGLAIYFAERNKGDYHNLFMTFSAHPKVVELSGRTLEEKIRHLAKAEWGMNTNLAAAFEKVLEIAITSHTPQEDMPKSIIVISDMEIDYCGDRDWTFYDNMAARYQSSGYQIPNIVFWNVNSRNNVFHADKGRKGVQLCSGQAASTFQQLMGCVGYSPLEMMYRVIGSERYECITVEG